MPEKMKICPNCNNELDDDDWVYYDKDEESWFSVVEKWFCKCPHCKKELWAKLPYELSEESIDIEYCD